MQKSPEMDLGVLQSWDWYIIPVIVTVGATDLWILAKKMFTPGKAQPRAWNWVGLNTQDKSGLFFRGLSLFLFFNFF